MRYLSTTIFAAATVLNTAPAVADIGTWFGSAYLFDAASGRFCARLIGP